MGGIKFTGNGSGTIAAGSAINGVSVDSGKVVFGNDTTDLTEPAILLSDREISLDGKIINFQNSISNPAERIAIGENTFAGADMALTFDEDGTLVFQTPPLSRPSNWWTVGLNLGLMVFQTEVGGTIFELSYNDGITDPVSRLQTALRIDGWSTFAKNVSDNVASPVNVQNTQVDSNRTFTNLGAAGAITFQLPATPVVGAFHTFIVQAAFNVIVTADAADTIRIGALAKAAGGNLQSAVVGSCLTVQFTNDGWYATSNIGAWI